MIECVFTRIFNEKYEIITKLQYFSANFLITPRMYIKHFKSQLLGLIWDCTDFIGISEITQVKLTI